MKLDFGGSCFILEIQSRVIDQTETFTGGGGLIRSNGGIRCVRRGGGGAQ